MTRRAVRALDAQSGLLLDLESHLTSAVASIAQAPPSRTESLTVAFFDLAGSTSAKLSLGHNVGTERALVHNAVCRELVEVFGGSVRKDLGDGILATFRNPLDAVHAGLNAIVALDQHDIATKVGVAAGLVELRKISGHNDVLGSAVDRAARIQALARPRQLLVDEGVFTSIESHLPNYPDLQSGPVEQREVSGIATLRYREIRLSSLTPFVSVGPVWVEETGRPTVDAKVTFLSAAKRGIVEIGAGLTTLVDYYYAQPVHRFRQPMRDLVSRGVNLQYVLANPDSPAVAEYFKNRGEPAYLNEIRTTIERLKLIREEFAEGEPRGAVEIRTLDDPPDFNVMAVDMGGSEPAPDGMMMVSHYLAGISRSDSPVIHFDRKSNPTLYDKYWTSVSERIRSSRVLE
jgi:class 3 adenylate cyclase